MLQSPRLILREIQLADAEDLFEMDSDAAVHRFIENKPVTKIEEIHQVVEILQKQYKENGIARWAVEDKISGECLGWCGLKFFREPLNGHANFYELGYRFKQKHWGKGYATESARAVLEYAFKNLPIDTIYAITHPENVNSKNVLFKLGFRYVETFNYDGDATDWFEVKRMNLEL